MAKMIRSAYFKLTFPLLDTDSPLRRFLFYKPAIRLVVNAVNLNLAYINKTQKTGKQQVEDPNLMARRVV